MVANDTKGFDTYPIAQRAILDHHVRANITTGPDTALPKEMGLWCQHRILPDTYLGVNNRCRRIDNGHSGEHSRVTESSTHPGFQACQIDTGIDTRDLLQVRNRYVCHSVLLCHSDGDDIGEILFTLGVDAADML